eukprot:456826_1
MGNILRVFASTPKPVVDNLKEYKYKKEDLNNQNNDDKNVNDDDLMKKGECSVCKDKFCDGDLLKQLPCNHRYHKQCIIPWLKKNNTCPMCRYPLKITDNIYYQKEQITEGDEDEFSPIPIVIIVGIMVLISVVHLNVIEFKTSPNSS